MKKKKLNKVLVAIISSAIIGGIGLNSSAILGIDATAGITVKAAQTVNVSTAAEFETALKNVNVTTINVTADIKMTRNITNIPARDFEIIGNKNQGFTINSGNYSLYGKQGTLANTNAGRNNTLSITNASIVGDQTVGRFFTGGAGNGPSSYGWDVKAKDVTYTGARFLHLSEGKLIFDGTNDIQTRCENAWVHDLEFLPGSVYKGQAAMKDHGQFSAFYFNGRLVNGQTTGKVDIGNDAMVDVVISPQSNVNYYYPVFYDKVYQVNVGNGSFLNVDAAGVAFQFIPRADYKNIPSLNLDQNSLVKFNGRGAGICGGQQAVKLQEYGTQVNQDLGSELYIDGASKNGVIESVYEFGAFNLYGASELSLTNHLADAPIFRGDRTYITGASLERIYTWNRDGGDYPLSERRDTFETNGTFETYVGLGGDAYNNDISAEVISRSADIVENFQMSNYGRVVFTGNAVPYR